MIRILLVIYSCASVLSASTLNQRYNLTGTSSKSDDAFANVISEINRYIKNEQFDVHKLIDFPINLPLASVNLFNGQMRDFSSIELHKSSILQESDQKLYWTLGVGLQHFSLQYDFRSNFFDLFKNSGSLKMTVPKNNILLSGTIEVSSTKCSTTLEIVTFMDFPDFNIEVQPLSIKNFFVKHLLEFAVNNSKLLLSPTLNSNLKDFILDMVPPSKLNEILCKYLSKFS